ncbi:MAG: hypothetical protein GX868_13740 [Actinobacteria bacterium]|nr:hypothetical protein [Actinomycetota bacterium]
MNESFRVQAGGSTGAPAGLVRSIPFRLSAWGVAALGVALVHNRLWATPNLAFFSTIATRLGENPFAGSPIEGDYLLSNLLNVAIARALGQTAPHEFARLHLALFVLAMIGVVALVQRRFGYGVARSLVVLCAFAPATTVVMQWLGQPDALTFPLAMAIVAARPPWAKVCLGVLLGLSHSEQGLAAALIAGAAAVAIDGFETAPPADTPRRAHAGDSGDRRTAGAATARLAGFAMAFPLLGVLLGRGIVELYFRLNDIVIETPRSSFLDYGLGNFVDHHLISPAWLAWSLWGPLWVGIVAAGFWLSRADSATPRSRRAAAALAVGAAAGLAPMAVTLDQTRVYSMVTAPLLVAAAVGVGKLLWPDHSRDLNWRPVSVAALLMFVPGMFCAGEAYFASALSPIRFTHWLIDGKLDPGANVTDFLMGPFGFEPPEISNG